MIGLPTETDEDVLGIADLAEKVVDAYFAQPKETRNKSCQVVVSTSCFVPKPFTPFQWFGQVPMEDFVQKQDMLKKSITSRKVKYNWHASDVSFYEAVLARGDRRLGAVPEVRGAVRSDGGPGVSSRESDYQHREGEHVRHRVPHSGGDCRHGAVLPGQRHQVCCAFSKFRWYFPECKGNTIIW